MYPGQDIMAGMPGNQGFAQTSQPWTLGWDQLGAWGKAGVVGQGASAFSSLANVYAAFKALDFQKESFRFQKDAWNKNYAATAKDYENTLKDRWTARDASARLNGRDFQSMDSYLADRRIGT